MNLEIDPALVNQDMVAQPDETQQLDRNMNVISSESTETEGYAGEVLESNMKRANFEESNASETKYTDNVQGPVAEDKAEVQDAGHSSDIKGVNTGCQPRPFPLTTIYPEVLSRIVDFLDPFPS